MTPPGSAGTAGDRFRAPSPSANGAGVTRTPETTPEAVTQAFRAIPAQSVAHRARAVVEEGR